MQFADPPLFDDDGEELPSYEDLLEEEVAALRERYGQLYRDHGEQTRAGAELRLQLLDLQHRFNLAQARLRAVNVRVQHQYWIVLALVFFCGALLVAIFP